ncbi:hypothetical protein BpHYR1_018603 [Brachionus plicatilis]|uniref:Uncharacterized protein n=1 Tax=Brachionus plicatilis TaxID=10195 RepID=A0A3M7R5U8_BRAPC|nr:hypothetical protein BpHYR1_018603 [Brachionus plicatilis]
MDLLLEFSFLTIKNFIYFILFFDRVGLRGIIFSRVKGYEQSSFSQLYDFKTKFRLNQHIMNKKIYYTMESCIRHILIQNLIICHLYITI